MRGNRILAPAGSDLRYSLLVKGSKVGGLGRKYEARSGRASDTRRWRLVESIDDLQNCGRSRLALRGRGTTMMMGEKDNERREAKVRTPF